jgi:hypothetical protein
MLRDLATLIGDLHHGMQAAAERAGPGVRIAQATTTLPVDAALVLERGGCTLRVDVARQRADTPWLVTPSLLTLHWGEWPTDALLDGATS